MWPVDEHVASSSGSLTGTLDEGPVVASIRRTETLIQYHVPVA